MFSTELNTFAPSLFNDDGTMRLIEDKSKLKRDIQVTIPARCVPKPIALIVNVSQLLWVLEWPKSGRLESIVIISIKRISIIGCDSSTLGFMHVTAGSSLFRDNATGVMNSKNRNIGDMVHFII